MGGEARVDQHQPHPRLLGRLGARVYEVEHPIQLPKALDVWMAQGQLLHVADLEVGSPGQCVQPGHRVPHRPPTPEVECRAFGVVTAMAPCLATSDSRSVSLRVTTPVGGRWLPQFSSIGMSRSTHFAPSIAAAAKPLTTPSRPDHSQAAIVLSSSVRTVRLAVYTSGSTRRYEVRSSWRVSTPRAKASLPTKTRSTRRRVSCSKGRRLIHPQAW